MSCPKAPATLVLAVTLIATLARAAPQADPPEEETPPQILGTPSEIREAEGGAGDLVALEPGMRLYDRPDVRSSNLAMIDAVIELPVLERREHWVQVRYGSWKGWTHLGDGLAEPAEGGRLAPDHLAWRLALARQMLGASPDREPRSLGPFALHTDVEKPRLLRFLSRISSHLPEAYRDRYGLEPRPAGGDAVVLFSREADYRAYEAQVRPETDRGALGHAAYGLAVLYVGRQGPEDVAAVLVHELTHVLSHRTLAAAPPPWLDEGMANDLAFCRIDGARRLVIGSLGGRSVVIEEHSYQPGGWIDFDQSVHLSGPSATRVQLRDRWRTGAISIEELSYLPAGQFFDPEDRQVHYDASAFFIRYLLDGEEGALAPAFHSFLGSLAGGDPPDLASHLGRSWPELERGFEAWLIDRGPLHDPK